jgi:hypothetical protein
MGVGKEQAVPISFYELNLYIYESARGPGLDAVIWCLGPLVDDTREYGFLRLYLAAATYHVCRRLIHVED